MNELRRRFNRFCFRNRDKGIPNLMLYVTLATATVYLINMVDPSDSLFYWLYFDRTLILRGQIWRLITFPLIHSGGGGEIPEDSGGWRCHRNGAPDPGRRYRRILRTAPQKIYKGTVNCFDNPKGAIAYAMLGTD